MPKAINGKRLLNLPEAAEYSLWAFHRGVEHGKREAITELKEALQQEQVELPVQTKLLETLEGKHDK